jgi:hypothetical protein
VMCYVPRAAGNESSNWWRPTQALVRLWLEELGFTSVTVQTNDIDDDHRGVFLATR